MAWKKKWYSGKDTAMRGERVGVEGRKEREMRYANGWVDGEVEGKKQTKRKEKERRREKRKIK